MDGLVVLISGRGSNLQAICKAGLMQSIKAVISNTANADGILFAHNLGIATHIIEHKNFPTRDLFDHELDICIKQYNPRLIVLAGFMRILTPKFVKSYVNRLINIHPSLLPSFVGGAAQKSAIKAQVKISGATVHFVTEKLDHGPIIAQGVVRVKPNDSEEVLSARILELEHTIYPFIIKKFLYNQITLNSEGQVVVTHSSNDYKELGNYSNQIYY